MYLREDIVRQQLQELTVLSSKGSRLALDFVPPIDHGTSQNRRQNVVQRLARTGSGESLRLTVDSRQAVELVTESGWDVFEVTSMRDAARSLVPHDAGLPIESINPEKTVVAATTNSTWYFS